MDNGILVKAGINYSQGVDRFVGNEALYCNLLKEFCKDKLFLNLEKCIKERNYTEAFKNSHALKGACGNLSLNKLYQVIYMLTEELRNNPDETKVNLLFKDALLYYKETVSAISGCIE